MTLPNLDDELPWPLEIENEGILVVSIYLRVTGYTAVITFICALSRSVVGGRPSRKPGRDRKRRVTSLGEYSNIGKSNQPPPTSNSETSLLLWPRIRYISYLLGESL